VSEPDVQVDDQEEECPDHAQMLAILEHTQVMLERYERKYHQSQHDQNVWERYASQVKRILHDRIRHGRVRRLPRTWADYNVNTGSRPSGTYDEDELL
jgi:hypothetical protein